MADNVDPSQARPIILSADVTIGANSDGRPNVLGLKNPTGEHWELREIGFSVTSSEPGVSFEDLEARFLTGATIGVKLSFGNEPLTNEYIPIWNFGKMIHTDPDQGGYYTWRLKNPIYVPAGGLVLPEFYHFGMIPQDLAVRITYRGRILNPGDQPGKIHLPWVAVWRSKVFPMLDVGEDQSDETQLLNPHQTPITLERFSGRVNCYRAEVNAHTEDRGDQTLEVRVANSRGDPIAGRGAPDGAGAYLPFRQVFGYLNRTWEQRRTLIEPGGFYRVFLRKTVPAVGLAADTVQANVTIVGWREGMLTTDDRSAS